MSVSLSLSLSFSLCLTVSQSLGLYVGLSPSLSHSFSLFVSLFLFFSLFRSVIQSVRLSLSLYVGLFSQSLCLLVSHYACLSVSFSDTVQIRGPVSCRISRTYREWTYSPLIGQYFIGHFYWWVGLKLFWIWMTSPYFLKIGNTVSFLSWNLLSKSRHWVFPTTLTKMSLIQEVFNEFPCGKKT